MPLVQEFSDFDKEYIKNNEDLSNIRQISFATKYDRFMESNGQNLAVLVRKQKEDQEENQNNI